MECPLCLLEESDQKVVFCDELVWFVQDQRYQGALKHSGIIIAIAHRETVFDLTEPELAATFRMLRRVKAWMDAEFSPDGYNVGWNCPRFDFSGLTNLRSGSGRRLSVIACREWGRDAGPEVHPSLGWQARFHQHSHTSHRLLQDRAARPCRTWRVRKRFHGRGREPPTFDELILITKYLVVRNLQGEQCR